MRAQSAIPEPLQARLPVPGSVATERALANAEKPRGTGLSYLAAGPAIVDLYESRHAKFTGVLGSTHLTGSSFGGRVRIGLDSPC